MANRLAPTDPEPLAAEPDGSRRRSRHRGRQHVPSSSAAPADAPDLAAVASQAVFDFLRDASATGARHEAEAAARAVLTAETRASGTERDAADQGARDVDAIRAALQASLHHRREWEDAAEAPGSGAPSTAASLATQLAMPAGASAVAARFTADSVALRAAAASIATLERIEAAAAKVAADIRTALRIQAELQAGAAAAAEAAVRAAQAAWEAADTAVDAQTRAELILRLITRYSVIGITIMIIIMIIIISRYIPVSIG
jgi:hypothetical protein